MTITAEDIRRMQAQIRSLWIALGAVSLLSLCAVVWLAMDGPPLAQAVAAEDPEDRTPWHVAADGTIQFDGTLAAAGFVVRDAAGVRLAELGLGSGDPDNSGPGVRVYSADGTQSIAAMWREDFAGRSRLKIGDVGTRPMEVIGNGLDALLVAPNLLTYTDPIVRAPSE